MMLIISIYIEIIDTNIFHSTLPPTDGRATAQSEKFSRNKPRENLHSGNAAQ